MALLAMLARYQPPVLLQAARALCAAAEPELWCTQIKLVKGKTLEVEFNTGEWFSLPAEYLRVESPAAGNLDARDAAGRLKVVHGRRHVGIMGVEPVGSYAVRLSFDDMHSAGIYTWPYLHELGTHKLSRMRRYLRLLRERGLSRDPPALLHHRARSSSGSGSGTARSSSRSSSSSSGGGKGSEGSGAAGSSAAGTQQPSSSGTGQPG